MPKIRRFRAVWLHRPETMHAQTVFLAGNRKNNAMLKGCLHRLVTTAARQCVINARAPAGCGGWQHKERPVKRVIPISLLGLAALGAATFGAAAQSSGKTGQYDAWGTYVYQAGDKKTCYILGAPLPNTAKPAGLDHGDNYFLVSQKPGENVSFEPQFIAGYTMQENGKVVVTVDAKDFSMFIRGKSAWMENAAEEPALIAAMKNGKAMSVAAKSAKGNATSYEFSLKGVTKALQQIQSCK
jgi:Invasion associated locus B (IalB) protein